MPDPGRNIFKHPDLKQMQSWVYESMWASREWRRQSWRCQELYDGGAAQWTQADWNDAKDAGITPITVNRTFPTLNLVLGYQILNQFDVIAKGRTYADTELGNIMSEGIQFVTDQCGGQFLIQEAFRDAIIPGIGCLAPGLNSDPRKEKVMYERLDWKETNWDPFSSPWWSPERTRYVYKQRWMDLDDLKVLFWEKRKEIEEQFHEFTSKVSRYNDIVDFEDEGAWVEEHIKSLSGTDWTDEQRRRVRPIELWYPIPEKALFALFADGRYIELKDDMPLSMQYQIVQSSQQVVSSIVRKMKVCTFFGDVILQQVPSPFPHDQFPVVPFVGYIDRYGFPYGVPFQIEGMQEEVNKRRSMAMALLKSRRVYAEQDAAPDPAGLERLYEEANKLDGFMVLKPGAMGQGKFKIVENSELAPSQVNLMASTENEINEIVGANLAAMGYESNETSGIAIEKRQRQAAIVVAPLFENQRRSLKMLGEQTASNIQGFWTGEKVLRITDKLTSAERFVEINKMIQGPDGAYVVKNNIAQVRVDIIVSESPQTDTMREKNMEMIIEAVKKSPPETIPQLMFVFFELSSLPNKQQILAKIQPLLGVSPEDEEMTAEERKAKVIQELEAQRQQQQKQMAMEDAALQLELQQKELENAKLQAEIDEILSRSKESRAQTVAKIKKQNDDVKIKRFKSLIDLEKVRTERQKVQQEGRRGEAGTQ